MTVAQLFTNATTFLQSLLTPLFGVAVVATVILFGLGLLLGGGGLMKWAKYGFFASIIFGLGSRAAELIRGVATTIGGGS